MKATNAFFGTLAIAFAFSAPIQAQFLYTTIGDAITITGYTGSGGVVVIPPNINGLSVTSIGEEAFIQTSLTSVTIPNSVTGIGVNAFYDCTSLTNVTIGDGVTNIGAGAFSDAALTGVTIPNSVTSIGESAFGACFGLASVTIGNGVTSIGSNAFSGCDQLTSVTIPNSVTSIGKGAFLGCSSLTGVTIGNSVNSIGDGTFLGCSGLTSVTIPNSVTSIGDEAFLCNSLTGVYFEGNAPSAGSTVFEVTHAMAYYFYGTTGWSAFSANTGIPAVMLNPPPGTMVGDGFFIEISDGIPPLASYGYSILLVGDSGNSWNLIGLYNVQNDSGTYTYTNTGPYATVIMNDGTQTDNIRLTFTSPTGGTFLSDITSPEYFGFTQSGSFVAATGTALNSIAGLNVSCSVANGYPPFATSGSFTLVFATSGNTYIMKSGTGVRISSGRYSYSVVNRSTAAIQITDSVAGSFMVYVGFSSQLSGGYAIKQPSTGGFQIGSFSGTTPPVETGSLQVTITPAGAITAGARWHVDGGTLLGSGVSIDLPVGNHTVSFNSVNGWTAPENPTISMKAKTVTKVTGTYTFNGAGVYNGLFMQQAAIVGKAGMLASLTVTASGAYSGKLLVGGSTYTIRGNFSDSGIATNIISQTAKQGSPLTLNIQINWSNSPVNIGGTVLGTDDGAWVANLTAELASGAEASAEYTALLLPAGGLPGYGYMQMTNHAGAVVLAGSLPDGSPFSEAVPVSVNGELPVYGNLYGSSGLLIGWLSLESGLPAGNLTWIKEASRSSALYTNGLTNLVQVQGSPWTNPSPRTAAIDLPSGQLDISGGSLVTPLSFNVAVSNNNTVAKLPGGSTNSLTGSINPKTGLFTVTFGNGDAKATTSGTGAVLQNVTNAAGFFLGKTNAGALFLHPN
jgi:hypothetical protein